MLVTTLLLFLALLPAGGEPDFVVVLRTGERVRAEVVEARDDGVLLRTGDTRREIPRPEVVGIRFPEADSAPIADGSEVLLSNGDRLLGALEGGSQAVLRLRTTVGAVEIPIESLRRVIFPTLRMTEDTGLDLEPHPGHDTLYRTTGKGVDVVEGTLISFGEGELVFSGPVGEFTFRYPELAALVLMEAPAVPAPPGPSVRIRLRDGTTFSGDLVELDSERLSIESPILGRIQVPVPRIASLSLQDPSYRFLSDLEPVAVRETPYFGDEAEFLFRFRRDRTVTGGPLVLGGFRFEKGLGVHARSSLDFGLEEGYRSFHAIVGLDDEVKRLPATGRVVFRVLVDGTPRFESGLVREGDAPVTIPELDVQGAKRLTLEVDFGDASDSGDRAIWANPLLVR